MTKKCIIHIGMHKTGSSSIQNTLFKNRELVQEKHDVNYFDHLANHSILTAAFHENKDHLLQLLLVGHLTTAEKEQSGRQLKQ